MEAGSGLVSDINGSPIGPYMDKPSREYGDILVDVWPEIFRDKYQDGSGPVYMNCTRTDDEDLGIYAGFISFRRTASVVDYIDQYNVDLKRQMIEFYSYNNDLNARGIEISTDASTNYPRVVCHWKRGRQYPWKFYGGGCFWHGCRPQCCGLH